MWKCHKCHKPVYFAERKQSLGYNWHPECLRCEECGKRLNPGQHAEHKGVPYCHVPCYGALFGPQLFGHGTRVESHKSFGAPKEAIKLGNGPVLPRSTLESKIKVYNQFFEGKSGEIRCREVNGRYILEGSLRIHWGVQGVIHLKENDDQRTVVTVRKRNSCRVSSSTSPDLTTSCCGDTDEDVQSISRDTSSYSSTTDDIVTSSNMSDSVSLQDLSKATAVDSGTDSLNTSISDISSSTSSMSPTHEQLHPKSVTLPSKFDVKNMEWDELDELLQVERKLDDNNKLYRTMPVPLPSQSSTDSTNSASERTINNTCSSTLTSSEQEISTLKPSLLDENDDDSSTLKAPLRSNGEDAIPLLTRSFSKDDSSWVINSNQLNRSMSGPDCLGRLRDSQSQQEFDNGCSVSYGTSLADENQNGDEEEVVLRRPYKTGSTAIRRRPGKRLSRSKVKRRCSINGHFYDRETSFFTPPHGSQMSVWVTSLVNTHEVVNLLLEKYKVESDATHFALFAVRDNGEQRRLKDDEYPLLARVLLGPHEDVVKLFLMDGYNTPEVSSEVAQFLNLSLVECRAILNQYYSQEEKEVARIKEKYHEIKKRAAYRLQQLKAG